MSKTWKMYRLDEESDKIISELAVKWVIENKKPMSKQAFLNEFIKTYYNWNKKV